MNNEATKLIEKNKKEIKNIVLKEFNEKFFINFYEYSQPYLRNNNIKIKLKSYEDNCIIGLNRCLSNINKSIGSLLKQNIEIDKSHLTYLFDLLVIDFKYFKSKCGMNLILSIGFDNTEEVAKILDDNIHNSDTYILTIDNDKIKIEKENKVNLSELIDSLYGKDFMVSKNIEKQILEILGDL